MILGAWLKRAERTLCKVAVTIKNESISLSTSRRDCATKHQALDSALRFCLVVRVRHRTCTVASQLLCDGVGFQWQSTTFGPSGNRCTWIRHCPSDLPCDATDTCPEKRVRIHKAADRSDEDLGGVGFWRTHNGNVAFAEEPRPSTIRPSHLYCGNKRHDEFATGRGLRRTTAGPNLEDSTESGSGSKLFDVRRYNAVLILPCYLDRAEHPACTLALQRARHVFADCCHDICASDTRDMRGEDYLCRIFLPSDKVGNKRWKPFGYAC